ncbi:MAG: SDR family oxidoreductase [Actinobacteria bacterium]|nr:SDR family oxidoreductase [Actinomycetota bacterium]MBU1943001.1 SDR family oxidoreductase [Actinomycetota bacterium]MBU2687759.1 SDR family oxidoreductase [Actinomycetota bacterium]
MDFTGKSIFITGAGAGIGKTTAMEMASRGGLLAVTDIDLDRAGAVVSEIEEAGGTAIAIQTDVTGLADVEESVARAIEAFGKIDVLVNNAGWAHPSPLIEGDPADWDKDIQLCLYGVINGCRAVLPGMIDNGSGRIVNICSDAGRVGEPGLAVYSAAKAGVVGLSKAVAKEVARHGVLVNCVCFSCIRTEYFADLFDAGPELEQKMVKRYPMRRVGTMQEAANAIMMMASEYATFITGQVLSVNGGYAMCD